MAISYDEAVQALYRGALDTFVAERKRLAAELKAAGDKEGSARFAKLGRPSISAWAVNQLWWNERQAFEGLLATAARLRKGDHDASAAHQRALAELRGLAAGVLTSGGHGASEATLRRVTTTLAALAAAGGFQPDAPGALAVDRDPPGFETFDIAAAASFVRAPKGDEREQRAEVARKLEDAKHRERAEQKLDQAEQERMRVELEQKRAAEERRLLEEAQARKRAERQRLEAALTAARAEALACRRDAERLRLEVSAAERKLEKADAAVAKLKEALAALG
jgi:hypothetical protein